MNTPRRLFVRAFCAALLFCPAVRAATFSWDGGTESSEDWTVPANWLGNTPPPLDGTADLVFSGGIGLSPNANLDWSARSITFASGGLGFSLHGYVLTLGPGGITNADDSVQTVGNDLILSAAQTFRTTSTGSMAINGSINTNGRILTVDAAADFITLGGAITGGGGVVVTGSQSLVFAGGESNTYTGGTTINGPVVLAKTGGAIAIPGAVIIGGAASPATLAIGFDEQIGNASSITVNAGSWLSLGSGVTETIGALSLSGTAQLNNGTFKVGTFSMFGSAITSGAGGKIVLGGESTAVSAGLQRAIISGNLNLGGAARTITVVDGPADLELEIGATVSNGSLVKEGAGRVAFTGTQSHSSLLAHQGTVDLQTAFGTGASSVSVIPVAGPASVNFETSQRLAALTIGSGGIVTLTTPGSFVDSGDTSVLPFFSEEMGERGSVAQAVPEPTAGVLIFLAVATRLAWGRGNGKKWSGREDLNLRPPGPKPGALPS